MVSHRDDLLVVVLLSIAKWNGFILTIQRSSIFFFLKDSVQGLQQKLFRAASKRENWQDAKIFPFCRVKPTPGWQRRTSA